LAFASRQTPESQRFPAEKNAFGFSPTTDLRIWRDPSQHRPLSGVRPRAGSLDISGQMASVSLSVVLMPSANCNSLDQASSCPAGSTWTTSGAYGLCCDNGAPCQQVTACVGSTAIAYAGVTEKWFVFAPCTVIPSPSFLSV
jgi:hypothetical protein